jgi:hypothetical protein
MFRRTFLKGLLGTIAALFTTKIKAAHVAAPSKVTLVPSDVPFFKPRFLNGKQCETLIVDRVDEIADEILKEYGWENHPYKLTPRCMMISDAKWCSDMASTREVMIESFMREKDYVDASASSQDYWTKLKDHNMKMAMQKLGKTN